MIGGSKVTSRDNTARFYTEKKMAFMGGKIVSAVAGQYPQVQLWNPADSGVLLYMTDMSHLTIGTNERVFEMLSYATALGSDGTESNKYIGEAGPVGQVKWTTNVARLGTVINEWYYNTYKYNFRIDDPYIIIPEEMGVNIAMVVTNQPLSITFEWIEVPI